MQAQAASRPRPSSSGSEASSIIALMAAMHVVLHLVWYVVPSFVDTDDVGTAQYIVITATLTLGLVALAGLWKGQRWGWWLMVVMTAINIFLTLPELFVLEGLMRVTSIVAMAVFLVTLILLFRPEMRAIRR